jgi:hypothetical protein
VRVHAKLGLLGDDGRVSYTVGGTLSANELLRDEERLTKSGKIAVFVNGEELPASKWDEPIDAEAEVVLAPTPGGGIDLLAILIYAVVMAAVSTAVNYAMQALNPPPKPPGLPQERGDESSPTYSWGGVQTVFGQGGLVPFVYGRHAVGGQVIYTDVFARTIAGNLSEELRVIYALSEGPIAKIGDVEAVEVDALGGWSGQVSGGTIPDHIRLNNNLLDAADPLPGAFVYIRPGTLDQTPLPSNPFRGSTSELIVNERLDDGGAEAIFTVSTSDLISTIGFVISFPGGLFQQDPQGNLSAYPVDFEPRWRPQGQSSWRVFYRPQTGLPIFTVTFGVNPSLGTVVESFGGDLQQLGQEFNGPIEIQLRRVTPRGGTDVVSQCVWRSIGVNFAALLAYPRVALLGMQILATGRLSGSLPALHARVDGCEVRVWDDVDGFSDPTWEVPAAPHNFMTNPPGRNPAWILGDFLTQPWGLGNWITDNDVDWDSLRRWSIFCDIDPNVGAPWGEAAFTFDGVGDAPRPAWETVLAICAAGRATPVIRGRKIGVVYQYRDAHSDAGVSVAAKAPVQTFTSGNVEQVQVNWLPKHERPTAFQFQFLNEDKLWEQDVLTVEDQEGALNDPSTIRPDLWRPEVIQAFGETRPNQLIRRGWWLHRVNRLVRRELSFVTGPWALAAEIGDLFEFQHDVLRPFSADVPVAQNVLVGGAATSTVTVDHPVSGGGLEIVVRNPDGEPERADISTTTPVTGGTQLGLASTVTVDAGAPCAVGLKDKLTEIYQIVAITIARNLKREVRALQWVPGIYDPLPSSIATDTPVDDFLEQANAAAPPLGASDLRIVTLRGGAHRITWVQPPLHTELPARVYARDPLVGAWYLLGESTSRFLDYEHFAPLKAYEVAVVLDNQLGGFGLPDDGEILAFEAEEFPLFGAPLPRNVRIDQLKEGLRIRWEPLEPLDLQNYEIRIGAHWATGERVYRGKLPAADILAPPTGPATYQIAARSRSGLYSPRAVELATWAHGLAQEATVDELDGGTPGGTHSGTEYVSATQTIELQDETFLGTYTGEIVDCGYQAPFLFLVHVDGEEIDPVTIDELTFAIDSGEAIWRTCNTRPASPMIPGVNWETLVDDFAIPIDDLPDDLLVQGFRGESGHRTIARVESRYYVDSAWGDWTEHENGVRIAERIQVRVFLGRERTNLTRTIHTFTVEALI